MTTLGTAWAITSQGVSMRSTSRDAGDGRARGKAEDDRHDEAEPGRKRRDRELAQQVPPLLDDGDDDLRGRRKDEDRHLEEPDEPFPQGQSDGAAQQRPEHAGGKVAGAGGRRLGACARSTAAIGRVVPTLIRRALPPSRNARGCAGRWT